MAETITDVIPSNTSGLINSSDLEGNDETRNKNKEKLLPDELPSFTPVIVSAIDNIRNIK